MPSRVDLHTHTTASDGTLPPESLLAQAADLGVRYLAVTDHDTTRGYETLRPHVGRFPAVTLLPGIEINTEGDPACHLLGYFIDFSNVILQKELARYRDLRLERMQAMIALLNKEGIAVSMKEVSAAAGKGTIGRPHLADVLRRKGIVSNRKEAFKRFLKKGGRAYVGSEKPTAREAIELIRQAGGIPVLAHPSYDDSDSALKNLQAMGLMGIEAYYPEHGRSLTQRYIRLARELDLVCTGGSDFHGPGSGRERLASVDVPESVIAALEAARAHV